MKTISALALVIMMGLFLAACGCTNRDTIGSDNNSTVLGQKSSALGENEQTESKVESNNTSSTEEKNILVAYFSHSGNTREIANQIHENVGSNIFEIQSVDSYPSDYDGVVEQAKKELQSGYRPMLKTEVEDMESYGVIFIGYPNWWGTIPMPVASFLSEYNFSGKTIVPFCPHSTVLDGLAFRGRNVKKCAG